MGICWGSPYTPTSTSPRLSSAGLSQTTSNATYSRVSNISGNGLFSAASGDDFPNGQMLPIPNLRIFSFAELKAATKNFSSDRLLGEGGFAGLSQTTSNATYSRVSNISGNGLFSAASGDDFPNGQRLPIPNLRIFSFAELKAATKNFRSDTLLGEGGFGKVYKGWLDEKCPGKPGSGSIIAVKRLNSVNLQGFEEWQPEINFLGRLSHPNLVRLIGYFLEEKELLLVYEFMQKGSLENHLFGMGSAVQPLPWDIRIKIAIGAAKGLAFLHTSEKQVMIYREFKASNILLDGAYTAKISDFGLAKPGPSTRVMRIYGYGAPEYAATGRLHVKSDVYGFGVVLVEILSGLRALDTNRPSGRRILAQWIKPYLSDERKLKSIMDSRLEGKYPSKAAMRIAQLALNCLEPEPKHRPPMKEVVVTLERIESSGERQIEPRIRSNSPQLN